MSENHNTKNINKTRFEIIFKLNVKTSKEVINRFNKMKEFIQKS